MFMIKNHKLNLLDEFTCDPSMRVGEGSDDYLDVGCMTMGSCGKVACRTDFLHLRTPANSLFISFSVKQF
jgi:hypothetical protein